MLKHIALVIRGISWICVSDGLIDICYLEYLCVTQLESMLDLSHALPRECQICLTLKDLERLYT